MKICFISPAFGDPRGGNEVFASVFQLLSKEHEIVVITDKVSPSNSWKSVKISPRSISYLYGFNGYFFARAAAKKFFQLQQTEQFDILLINQLIGNAVLDLASLTIPSVYIIHHPVSVDVELASRFSGGVAKIRWTIAYWGMGKMQEKIVQKFKHVLTVSHASKDRIIKDYSIDGSNVEVIYNGIDTDFFKKTRASDLDTVIAVGSYQHPRKGFPYLRNAYQELSHRGFKILDVGRRRQDQSNEIRSIPHTEQFAVVKKEKLPDLYSKASVMISTSLFEGFGLSIIESLACETPVIAFAGGGVAEVLNQIDPNLICPAGETDMLVKKAIQYSQAPDRIERGQQYRHRVQQLFGIQQMADHYHRFIEKITVNYRSL